MTVGYAYNGCRFHRCPFECGVESLQTDEQFENQRKKKEYLLRVLTSLEVIQGCQWAEQKKILAEQNEEINSKVTPFLGRKNVSEEDIFKAIENGTFYGFCRVDIDTPTEVVEKYKKRAQRT